MITFAEYMVLASRTEKVLASVTGPVHPRMVHHALGYLTEMGEVADQLKKHYIYGKPLDVFNIVEEVGDACWYVAGMANHCGLEVKDLQAQAVLPPSFTGPEWTDDVGLLIRLIANTTGGLAYQPAHPSAHHISQCLSLCGAILRKWAPGYSMNDVMGINIAKLQIRYTDKYTDDDALIRKLDKERQVLEMRKG